MKRISFKAKTTVMITLLTAIVCFISFAGMLTISRRTVDSETQQRLISTVERNVDSIEYKNGILEIESDFAFYSDGIYCNVYDQNFALVEGETPQSFNSENEFKNGEISNYNGNNEKYYIYDTRIEFTKHEYEIDVFSGQIIKYEADAVTSGNLPDVEYNSFSFENGISTEKAINIALAHAGATRENATIITAELQAYDNRQVFLVEFTCPVSDYGSIWIRGIAPASVSENTFGAINKAILYSIPMLIVFAALGAYLLSQKTIKPVEEITRSAKEISTGKDLTKRIKTDGGSDEIADLANTFNQMLERLQTSFESEKQFTSDASHELRTPLAVIKAECEYALSDNADSAEKAEALVSVNEQADKMTRLVNSLLSLTRTEQGTQRFNFENIDLSETIEKGCCEFKTDKGITLKSSIENDINLFADISLIRRMLENLLENAVRYGKENGNIFVSLYRQNNSIILSVKDDGIGIKAEDIPKIWGRFYRADSSRSNSDGFGLGLALVERTADLHGGKADVKSTLGEGSEFVITFSEKN